MSLLRATLPVDLTTPYGRYALRQPRVGEALSVLGALQAEDYDTFEDVCRAWLPFRLQSELFAGAVPDDLAAQVVLDLVESGAEPPSDDPDEEASEEDSDSSENGWTDVDWSAHVADYMAAYGTSLAETLAEPWHGFLALLGKIDRIEARQALSQLHVEGLPHIKSDRERDKALESLRKRAGYSKPEEKPQSYEEQVAKLDNLFGA